MVIAASVASAEETCSIPLDGKPSVRSDALLQKNKYREAGIVLKVAFQDKFSNGGYLGSPGCVPSELRLQQMSGLVCGRSPRRRGAWGRPRGLEVAWILYIVIHIRIFTYNIRFNH